MKQAASATATATATALTPPQVAARYGVATVKVHRWIATGELRAVNLATTQQCRPRWRIYETDLADFEQRRCSLAVAVERKRQSERRQWRKKVKNVIEFF